jgi:hypothetical protein
VTAHAPRAAESDLFIVNHSCCSRRGRARRQLWRGDYPIAMRQCWTKHTAREVATQYFGIVVSNYRIEELGARRSTGLWPAGVTRNSEKPSCGSRPRRRPREAAVSAARTVRRTGDERVRVTPDSLADVQDTGLALVGILDGLEAALLLLRDPAPGSESASHRRRGRVAACGENGGRPQRSEDYSWARATPTSCISSSAGRGVFPSRGAIDVSRVVREHSDRTLRHGQC